MAFAVRAVDGLDGDVIVCVSRAGFIDGGIGYDSFRAAAQLIQRNCAGCANGHAARCGDTTGNGDAL